MPSAEVNHVYNFKFTSVVQRWWYTVCQANFAWQGHQELFTAAGAAQIPGNSASCTVRPASQSWECSFVEKEGLV